MTDGDQEGESYGGPSRDLDRDEIVDQLAQEIDEEDLVMRYNWADSP